MLAATLVAALLAEPPVGAPGVQVPMVAQAYGAAGLPATPVTPATPLPAAAPAVAWVPGERASLVVSGSYEELFASGGATHGGYVINTGSVGSGPIWVDITGAVGSQLSAAAVPIYPAMTTGGAPGAWRFPGTTLAVTVYGPAGSTFQAFGG